jgi:ribosomal protein L28
MKCWNCNKTSLKGNYRSFSNIANKRYFNVNIHSLNLKKILLFYCKLKKINNYLFLKNMMKKELIFKKNIYLCTKCLRIFKQKLLMKFDINFFKNTFFLKKNIYKI